MSRVDVVLLAWSALATVWWLLAIGLVAGSIHRRPSLARREIGARSSLSVFKPLPPSTRDGDRIALAAALESFVRQLDSDAEMLVGVPAGQESQWRPICENWRKEYPNARVHFQVRATPDHHANPKVAWLETLAPEARGDLWLWSDADVIAPPDFLDQIRVELAAAGGGAVTAPYCIRRVEAGAGMVDALFVNAEFLPGALLLGRIGRVKLAFGASILFRAADFHAKVRWSELGACLADDYLLGQRLAPVTISHQVVETCALETRFASALQHLYRWQKTIRWCRPGSFAALIFILPILGWLTRCVVTPLNPWAWAGLGFQYVVELLVFATLTTVISPALWRRGGGMVLLWPLLRVGSWVAVWLPRHVIWDNPKAPWRSLRRRA
ncbi:MAG TPA: hypothetical protein DCE44_05410 [Verrucomicrobiales bacterium]|nr:hypothetical protein [Verrucomicrobiales bacterium]